MTLSAGQVSLGVKADTTDFGKKLHDGIMGGVSGLGKAVGVGIMSGAAAVVAAGTAVMVTGIHEAMDASAGIAQLTAGIKSTGNAANVSVKGMTDLATSIQNMSGQTDDSIVASEQLLLTFTNIKNVGANKIFDDATLAAANMAAKMGGDAASQSILLGKALNDPVKGLTALQRVGVAFTESQKSQIKAMVASGDTMGAQKIILKELNTEFGGAAKAAGESLPGMLARGKRAFEDMSQTVVETILPIVTPAIEGIAGAIQKASPVIVAFAKTIVDDVTGAFVTFKPQIDAVREGISKVAGFITGTAVPAIKTFVQQFADSEGAGGRLRAVLQGIADYVTGTLIPAITGLVKWVGDNKTMVEGFVVSIVAGVVAFQAYTAVMAVVKAATEAWAFVQGILNGTLIANPIGLIVMAIAALVAGIIWVATKTTFFQDLWTNAMAWITSAVSNVVNWVKENWPLLLEILTGPIGLAVVAISSHWDTIMEFFKAVPGRIGSALGGLRDLILAPFKMAFNAVGGLWNNTIGSLNFNIPDWIPGIGGKGFSFPKIPALAEGGIVPATPGGRLVRVAEAGQDEAVVPLPKNGKPSIGGGNTYNVTVNEAVNAMATAMQVVRHQVALGA